MKFEITPSPPSSVDMEHIKQIGIKKLAWYKSKGWNKKKLIKCKIFPKSFVEKYWDKLNV